MKALIKRGSTDNGIKALAWQETVFSNKDSVYHRKVEDRIVDGSVERRYGFANRDFRFCEPCEMISKLLA